MFKVEDMLLESGLFWCVFDTRARSGSGRLVRAYAGAEGEHDARTLAAALNGGEKEGDDG